MLAVAMVCGGAVANDSSFGEVNGGIVLLPQQHVSMAYERLVLSEERVEVEYRFENHGPVTVTLPMAFPMPPMYFGESDHSKLRDFHLWVNDEPVKTHTRLVALLKDRIDVAVELRDRGWDETALRRYIDSLGTESPPGATPLPANWFDDEGEPLLTLREYHLWEQTFPTGKPVNIRHTYRPSLSTSVWIPAAAILESTARNCIDAGTRASIQAMEKADFQGIRWARLEYTLTTGGNWKDGVIGDFRLEIRKRDPKDMVALCFDGELTKTDPLTFTFSARNYRPTRDLDLLYILRQSEQLY